MARRALLGLVALSGVSTALGIYPDAHWDHVTKLTTSNFDSVVKAEVDAGRTFFVRWIASAGVLTVGTAVLPVTFHAFVRLFCAYTHENGSLPFLSAGRRPSPCV